MVGYFSRGDPRVGNSNCAFAKAAAPEPGTDGSKAGVLDHDGIPLGARAAGALR